MEPIGHIFEELLGKAAFDNIPRFEEDLSCREPNVRNYTALLSSDMQYNSMIHLFEKPFFAIRIPSLSPRFSCGRRLDNPDKLFVYCLHYGQIYMCRGARPLYGGPFTGVTVHSLLHPLSLSIDESTMDWRFAPLIKFIRRIRYVYDNVHMLLHVLLATTSCTTCNVYTGWCAKL